LEYKVHGNCSRDPSQHRSSRLIMSLFELWLWMVVRLRELRRPRQMRCRGRGIDRGPRRARANVSGAYRARIGRVSLMHWARVAHASGATIQFAGGCTLGAGLPETARSAPADVPGAVAVHAGRARSARI
jgi:hypothetical protein